MMEGKSYKSRLFYCLALTSSSLGFVLMAAYRGSFLTRCRLQIIWSIILSNGTPFLISLGFDEASTALIWSIAPICGTFVQPWFGALSDRHSWREQGRRAFLLGGAIATSIALVGFSLSQTQIIWFAGYFDRPVSEQIIRVPVKVNSVIWFSLLNIAIQPLQMASRAVIIENNDTSTQVEASAWASSMQGIGSILGFLLASVPLAAILTPGFATDFSILCLFGSVLLLASTLISASVIKEDPPIMRLRSHDKIDIITYQYRGFIKGLTKMPRQLWQIFVVQFFAWLGWFPFRTYYTSWLADTYTTNIREQSGAADVESNLQLLAAHLGSITGLYLSIIAFVANCALPVIVRLLDRRFSNHEMIRPTWTRPKNPTKAILHVWIASHLYLAFVLLFAGMVGSQTGVIIMIASIGLSWAVTLWAPFCLIGLLLSRKEEGHLNCGALDGGRQPQMGAIVGLHNAAISAPQIISALLCTVTFKAANNTGQGTMFSLLSGGCWTIVAAFSLWIFSTDLQHI